MPEKGTVERAFELARSGVPKDIDDIAKVLTREGHHDAIMQLQGRHIRSQLRRLLKDAQSTR